MHARFCVMQEATCILAREGINIFSPIVHWHESSQKFDLPTDAMYWQKVNYDTFQRCDGMYLLTLPGWEESVGVQMELGWAEGKPDFHIHYMCPNNLDTFKHFEKML